MTDKWQTLAIDIAAKHFPDEGRAMRAQAAHVVDELKTGKDPRDGYTARTPSGQAAGAFEVTMTVLKTITTLYSVYKMYTELRGPRRLPRELPSAEVLEKTIGETIVATDPRVDAETAAAIAKTCVPRLLEMAGER